MLHGTNPFSPTVQAWLANLLSFTRILIPILFLRLGCGGPGAYLDGGFAYRLPVDLILAGLCSPTSPLTRFWLTRRFGNSAPSPLSGSGLLGAGGLA